MVWRVSARTLNELFIVSIFTPASAVGHALTQTASVIPSEEPKEPRVPGLRIFGPNFTDAYQGFRVAAPAPTEVAEEEGGKLSRGSALAPIPSSGL
jgi:hypothetical protein